MDAKSYNIRVPKRWARLTLIVGVTALIVAPLTAVATHTFNDVPDTHTFHADIEWLEASGVTKGCNPPANTLFCPDDDVTRGQMAAFMKRFSQYLGAEDGTPAQADNADTVDGQHADDLVSSVFESRTDGYVSLPAGVDTTLQTLDLPPGSYLILARADLNNNTADTTSTAGSCSVTAEARSVVFDIPGLTGLSGPGDRYAFTEQFVHTFGGSGQVVLECTAVGWSGNAGRPTITAVSAPGGVAAADISAGAQGSGE